MVWYDATYGYKKKITIDKTKVLEDCTDFPVLISATDADLKVTGSGGHVQSANGYDIIFTNSTENTKLSHEIETYVSGTGQIAFWVKIPSLSSVNNTIIYMYYGKAGVVANPSTTDTWNANYVVVYHMNDADNSTTVHDSTANANHGTPLFYVNIYFNGWIDDFRLSNIRRTNNWILTSYNSEESPSTFMSFDVEEEGGGGGGVCVDSGVRFWDGDEIVTLCRDDASPVKIFDGTTVIGLELVASASNEASNIRVFDGTTIKSIRREI
jgi:hypothetical protein